MVLLNIHKARFTLADSPPGIIIGGWLFKPILKPVGHQSTNFIDLSVIIFLKNN